MRKQYELPMQVCKYCPKKPTVCRGRHFIGWEYVCEEHRNFKGDE